MNKEELLKIIEFTKEEINHKESTIKEIEENFSSDNIEAKNAVGMIILHLLTLRQKERVEQALIENMERLQRVEELLKEAFIVLEDQFGNSLSTVREIKSFLAEVGE